jgi:hypothetical protein
MEEWRDAEERERENGKRTERRPRLQVRVFDKQTHVWIVEK